MGMRCRKQRLYGKLPINNLWEVHLDLELWLRIVKVARMYKCSLSWITRYCTFRLARKKNLNMRKVMKIHSQKIITIQKESDHHRHIMCLYGNDEKLLRIAAMQLEVTVSQLIRLALYWFLPKLENKLAKWEHIYYHGTKICQYLSHNRKNILKIPSSDQFTHQKWSKKQWWNPPLTVIPIPYKEDFEAKD